MIKFKNCPRCRGDIRIDKDYYGGYENCIQCGYVKDLEELSEFQRKSLRKHEIIGGLSRDSEKTIDK
jgi:hypothetical protein